VEITPLKSTTDSVVVTPLKPTIVPSAAGEAVASGNVYLQLGAFRSQQSAESFLSRMSVEFEGSGKRVELYQKDNDMVRVHVGPYSTQDEARATAEKLEQRLGFKPLVRLH
jgi:rare lipoprotein A